MTFSFYGKIHYEHVKCEKKILYVACQEHFLLKISKYELGKTSLMYLGHIIGEDEFKLDLSKINAIMDWSTLKIVIWIRAFFGRNPMLEDFFF